MAIDSVDVGGVSVAGLPSSTQAIPSRLRGAIIGYGFIQSKGHVPTYVRGQRAGRLEIVAAADVCAPRLESLSGLFPTARLYSDYRDLLSAEAGDLDFVDIATPPVYHAEIARAALLAGAHVLCEKPLATNPADARAVLDAARRNRRVVFPCHNYKHAPVVRAIQEGIDSETIGPVRGLTLSTLRNTHAKGVPEWDRDWRRKRSHSGGGIAMDHGSHSFYLTFDWFGEYPVAITAKMANSCPGRFDTEDNFSAVLTFPSGLATVNLSWTAGVRKVIYTVQGDRGAITVVDDDWERSLMRATDGPDVAQGAVEWRCDKRSIGSSWMDASHVLWFESMFEDFLRAIRKQDFVSTEALDACACVDVIATAYQSAREGCRELPLAIRRAVA